MLSVDQNNTEESPYGNFSKYTEVNPYERAYDDMGRCIKRLSNGEANPVFDATLNNVNKSKSTSFNDNFDFEWYIVEGIRLTGVLPIPTGRPIVMSLYRQNRVSLKISRMIKIKDPTIIVAVRPILWMEILW